jgi:hypothetical protein
MKFLAVGFISAVLLSLCVNSASSPSSNSNAFNDNEEEQEDKMTTERYRQFIKTKT